MQFYQSLIILLIFLISPDSRASELKSYKANEVNKELLQASACGNSKAVEELLKKRADINSTERFTGKTSVMLAIEHKKQKVLDMLLTFGPNLDQQDSMGDTALMHALPDELRPASPYISSKIVNNTDSTPNELLPRNFIDSQIVDDTDSILNEPYPKSSIGPGPDDEGVDDSVVKIVTAARIIQCAKLINRLINAGANPKIKNKFGLSFQECITLNKFDDKYIKELKRLVKDGQADIDIVELMNKL